VHPISAEVHGPWAGRAAYRPKYFKPYICLRQFVRRFGGYQMNSPNGIRSHNIVGRYSGCVGPYIYIGLRVQNESRRPRTKMRWAVQLVAFLYLIPIRFVAPLTKTTIPANRCISITSSSGALRSAECSNSKCATIFCVRVTMTTKSNINTRAQPLTNQTNRNPYSEHTTRQHAMV